MWRDGRGGDKCGVAVLDIWDSRKWVAGERGTPSEIRSAHGCAAPDGVRRDPRSPQTPNAICDVRGSAAAKDVQRNSRLSGTRGPADCLT